MISYARLFKYLAEHDITRRELSEKTGITLSLLSRMRKNENVSLKHIDKICLALNCRPDDIMEYTP